ncbi:TetR/AcrR family transcriptional regulator [Pedobacter sp. ASV28]|uniref:TetR/AcrR family transcriptional regulator n=1 Tax=Pedobacter sp. ASV28 TaxID=2795123 RepID=UPI0018EC5AFA|nr:TetR/AcrR family transcriptional regulator [Pedobacter sp. ASV28]
MEEEKPNTDSNREKSREKSKQQLLDAVGKLLRTKGYAALKVNDIAATAGLDKKLIYRYFGSTDQLLDDYVLSQDFWSNIKGDKVPHVITDGGQGFVKDMLHEQFDTVFNNKELQKVLLWRLSQQRSSLKRLADEQELTGEQLFESIIHPHFQEKTATFRAISAILVSGLYYLNMTTAHNGSIFCGLDMASTEGRNEIKKALSFLIDQTYENL